MIGIDEAGRGPWAGPLVAAAVKIKSGSMPTVLKDSKQLSSQQRLKLFKYIQLNADAIGVGWASVSSIDKYGLTLSTKQAMYAALTQAGVDQDDNEQVIIDGNYNFLDNHKNCTTIIKGDESVPAVAAASVIAKVLRDKYMQVYDNIYPAYGFATNVGYGTKMHAQALELNGVCDLHRLSFSPVKIVSSK